MSQTDTSSEQCAGLISLNSNNSSLITFHQEIDDQIRSSLQKVPEWVENNCKASLRLYLCLQSYTGLHTEGNKPICQETCEVVRDACQGFFDLSGRTIFSQAVGSCKNLPSRFGQNQTPCIDKGGVLEDRQAAAFQLDSPTTCPHPFVVPTGSAWNAIPGTGCAVGCPGWFSPASQMVVSSQILLWTGVLTLPLSLFTISTLLVFRRKRHKPSLMFCVGAFLVSLIATLSTLGAQEHSNLLCNGNAAPSTSAGCKSQGFFLVACLIWCYCWSVGHIWDVVFRDIKTHYSLESCQERFQRYTIFSCSITLVCCIGLLSGNSFGYNVRSLLPVCFLRHFYSSGAWVEWTFLWAPLLWLVCLSLPAVIYIRNYTGSFLAKTHNERKQLYYVAMMRTQTFTFFCVFILPMVILISVCAWRKEHEHDQTSLQDSYIQCSLQYWSKSYKDRVWICQTGNMPIHFAFQIIVSFLLGIFGALPVFIFGKSHFDFYKEMLGNSRESRWKVMVAVARRGSLNSTDRLQSSVDAKQLTLRRQKNRRKNNLGASHHRLLQRSPNSERGSTTQGKVYPETDGFSESAPAVDLSDSMQNLKMETKQEIPEQLESSPNLRGKIAAKALGLFRQQRWSSSDPIELEDEEFAAAKGTLKSDARSEDSNSLNGFENLSYNTIHISDRKASAFISKGKSFHENKTTEEKYFTSIDQYGEGVEERKG